MPTLADFEREIWPYVPYALYLAHRLQARGGCSVAPQATVLVAPKEGALMWGPRLTN